MKPSILFPVQTDGNLLVHPERVFSFSLGALVPLPGSLAFGDVVINRFLLEAALGRRRDCLETQKCWGV